MQTKCPCCYRENESLPTGKTWFDKEEKTVSEVYYCNYCYSEFIVEHDIEIKNTRIKEK